MRLQIIFFLFFYFLQGTVASWTFQDSNGRFRKISNFQWSNCGPSRDPFKLNQFSISPSVLHFPEKVHVTASARLTLNTTAPVHVTLTAKRKVGPFWIKIPCDGSVGSCYYGDVCALSPFKKSSTCPSIFTENHLPCKCPIISGSYEVNNLDVSLPRVNLPEWLVDGKYSVQANAYNQANK